MAHATVKIMPIPSLVPIVDLAQRLGKQRLISLQLCCLQSTKSSTELRVALMKAEAAGKQVIPFSVTLPDKSECNKKCINTSN